MRTHLHRRNMVWSSPAHSCIRSMNVAKRDSNPQSPLKISGGRLSKLECASAEVIETILDEYIMCTHHDGPNHFTWALPDCF